MRISKIFPVKISVSLAHLEFPSWNAKNWQTITFSNTEDFYIHTMYKGVELWLCAVVTSGFCIVLNISPDWPPSSSLSHSKCERTSKIMLVSPAS